MPTETNRTAVEGEAAAKQKRPKDSRRGRFLLDLPTAGRPASPFVHRFQTERNKYLFDINTGRIVRVDAATWDAVADFGRLPENEIVRKYASLHTEEEITRACEGITHAQDQHKLFQPNHLQHIALPSRQEVEESMRTLCAWLVLHVTEDCNFRCGYCVDQGGNTQGRRRSKRAMSWEMARSALDDFLNRRERCDPTKHGGISFYGGEPLLNLGLIQQCVSYVRQRVEKAPSLHVTTNGSLLKGSAARFLTSEGFYICVSLDGPSHIHDQQRVFADGSGTWRTVANNVRAFLQGYPEYRSNGRFAVNAVLSPWESMTELEEYFVNDELASAVAIEFEPMMPPSDDRRKTPPESGEHKADLQLQYGKFLRNVTSGRVNENPEGRAWRVQRALFERRFRIFHERHIAQPGRVLSAGGGPREICIPGITSTYVTVDGSYYGCEKWPCREELQIGSVSGGRDPAKIHGLIRQFYSLNRSECASCWCVRNCRVGCFVHCIGPAHFCSEVKRKRCRNFRELMHQVIVDYVGILEQSPHAFDYLKSMPAPRHTFE